MGESVGKVDLRWRRPPWLEIWVVVVRGLPRATVAVKRGVRVGGVLVDRAVVEDVAAM